MEAFLLKEAADKVVESCKKVIVGKDEVIRLIFTSFLCSGHVLLEDVPGTGKPCCFGPLQRRWEAASNASSLLLICFRPI